MTERDSSSCRHNIKMYLEETLFESGGWIEMVHKKDQGRDLVVMLLRCNIDMQLKEALPESASE